MINSFADNLHYLLFLLKPSYCIFYARTTIHHVYGFILEKILCGNVYRITSHCYSAYGRCILKKYSFLVSLLFRNEKKCQTNLFTTSFPRSYNDNSFLWNSVHFIEFLRHDNVSRKHHKINLVKKGRRKISLFYYYDEFLEIFRKWKFLFLLQGKSSLNRPSSGNLRSRSIPFQKIIPCKMAHPVKIALLIRWQTHTRKGK